MKIAILIALMLGTLAMYGQADFSGSWKLNTDKSEFNQVNRSAAPTKLMVEQKAGTITYKRNERPKETLKIDSTYSINISDGDNKTIVSMKLAADKKGLVETRVYVWAEGQEGNEAKKIRTWTLSSDKKELTITDQIEARNGDNYLMVLVYERQ